MTASLTQLIATQLLPNKYSRGGWVRTSENGGVKVRSVKPLRHTPLYVKQNLEIHHHLSYLLDIYHQTQIMHK